MVKNKDDVMNKTFDISTAPKNKRVLVWIESDNYGPVRIWEIRNNRAGNWMGKPVGSYQWANDHGGLRANNPNYTHWRDLPVDISPPDLTKT